MPSGDTPPHPLRCSVSMEVRKRKEGSVGHPALMLAFPSPTILTSALKKKKAATCVAKPRIHDDWRILQAQAGPATAGLSTPVSAITAYTDSPDLA